MNLTSLAASHWNALREPVPAETRAHLARLWSALPEPLRGPRQMIGRQAEGCGATVGAMPRCDFACRGCYLGEEANRVPPATLEEVGEQLRALRPHLGRWGNLQLTDGELTLRPAAELIELVRRARALELQPMLMTHGETFLKDPGLLERLVTEGGLAEVCFHVDTTQRGRTDRDWRRAQREDELHPLREEFARLVESVRRRTGRPLRAASTVTVTRDNLEGVAGIARWFAGRADVFRILSFLPAAQVGRTDAGLGGRVGAEELWSAVAAGLGDGAELERGRTAFGHEQCTRAVLGLVEQRRGRSARFHPWRRFDRPEDERVVLDFFARWGGLDLRSGPLSERVARGLGVLARTSPRRALDLARYLARWARRLDRRRPLAALARLASGRSRLHPLAVVSHHFMGRDELATELGRERLAACTFRVAHGGRLVSMCEFNALGGRESLYADLRERAAGPGRKAARDLSPAR